MTQSANPTQRPDSRPDKLVAEVMAYISRNNGPFLPPLRQLAKQMKRDINEVSRALHRLRGDGLLSFRKGQRIKVVGPAAPPTTNEGASQGPVRSAEWLRWLLKTRISEGTLRSGSLLPKREYWSLESRLAPATVTKAYKMLQSDGLVHRRGKSFVVGVSSSSTVSRGRSPGVILLIQPKPFTWSGLKRERTAEFVSSFIREVENSNVQLIPCLANTPGSIRHFDHCGLREILSFVQELGDRFLGCIVVGLAEQIKSFPDLIEALTKTKRPLVWLNRASEKLPVSPRVPVFYSCLFSDEAPVRTAADLLVRNGHRRVAFIADRSEEWVRTRRKLLERFMTKSEPQSEVVDREYYESILRSSNEEQLATRFQKLYQWKSPRAMKVLSFFARHVAGRTLVSASDTALFRRMAAFILNWPGEGQDPKPLWGIRDFAMPLLDIQCTALVASNDLKARQMMRKIREIGIRVPQELSTLSFDNYLDVTELPITTIDFGSGYLGYVAFHTITRDIHLDPAPDGHIWALPRVIDRGSVVHAAAAKPLRGRTGNQYRCDESGRPTQHL